MPETETETRFDTAENGSVITCRHLPIAKMTEVLPAPRRKQVARIFAAAGTAVHALPPEYDPVAAVGALPKVLEAAGDVIESADVTYYEDQPATHHPPDRKALSKLTLALQKARAND